MYPMTCPLVRNAGAAWRCCAPVSAQSLRRRPCFERVLAFSHARTIPASQRLLTDFGNQRSPLAERIFAPGSVSIAPARPPRPGAFFSVPVRAAGSPAAPHHPGSATGPADHPCRRSLASSRSHRRRRICRKPCVQPMQSLARAGRDSRPSPPSAPLPAGSLLASGRGRPRLGALPAGPSAGRES